MNFPFRLILAPDRIISDVVRSPSTQPFESNDLSGSKELTEVLGLSR